LSLVPERQTFQARAAANIERIGFDVAELDGDGAAGEVSFIQASASAGGPSTKSKKRPALVENADPVTATLLQPWESAASAGAEAGARAKQDGPTDAGTEPGGAAGGAATSFFQVAARGRRIVYVLDGSASMGKSGLAAAGRELQESLKKLPAGARFQVIIYNSYPQYVLPRSFRRWLEPTPEILSEIATALLRYASEGRTEHGLALQEAFVLRPDVVFFLTDADDLTTEHHRLVQLHNQGRAVVNTIELNAQPRRQAGISLQILARENGGVYRAVGIQP
jgi:hypothetical protein